jgi:hypothetical protein
MKCISHRGAPTLLARWLLVLAVAALAAAGCGGGVERPAPLSGPAVWAGQAELAALDLESLDRLRAGGVRQLFAEGASIRVSGGATRVELPSGLAVPRRFPVTLVVAGDWPPADIADPEAAAAGLATALGAATLAAERARLVPVGVHLAVAQPAGEQRCEALAAALWALRRRLDPGMALSVEIDRRRLGEEATAEIAAAVDGVVVFLYGQRPGEPEDPAAWRLDEVEAALGRLEALGRPYRVGAVTLGEAAVVGRGGERRGATTRVTLERLAGDPALTLSRDLVLEPLDRRVQVFEAVRATRLGDHPVASGERVRTVRLAPRDLAELASRLDAAELEHYLGPLFYRLPAAGEGLSMSAAGLAAAAGGDRPAPEIALEVETIESSPTRLVIRVTATNRGDEPTGIARIDHNYVEVAVTGGEVASAAAGGFERYNLLHRGREATTMAALTAADSVRLFVPALDRGQSVTSGRIVLHASGAVPAGVTVAGRFLTPGGDVVEIEPRPVTG